MPGRVRRNRLRGRLARGILLHRGAALMDRFDRSGELAPLFEAIDLYRRALDLLPSDPTVLASLAMALQERHQHTGELGPLDEAIDLHRRALDLLPPGAQRRRHILAGLGAALTAWGKRGSELTPLDEAIRVLREAVALTGTDDPTYTSALHLLGMALFYRYERSGELALLDEAINLCRRALELLAAYDSSRPDVLNSLADGLREQYKRSGELALLDEATAKMREAVTLLPARDPAQADYLSNLGVTLIEQYECRGELALLDESIHAHRLAVSLSINHSNRARFLSNLGNALIENYIRRDELGLLDEAIENHRLAVSLVPVGHPNYARYLSNLGSALSLRQRQNGELALLDEMVERLREAATLVASDHLIRPTVLSTLGIALRQQYEHKGERALLDEAINFQHQVLDLLPTGHPDRARYLLNLGKSLWKRAEQEDADVGAAILTAAEAARVSVAPVPDRVIAGDLWGSWAASAGDWHAAAEGFAIAVSLLARLAPRALQRIDQEHQLEPFAGLASDAAACALQCGDATAAMELLEHGRGVLLAQVLETRSDLTELHTRVPQVAERFEQLSRDLDSGAIQLSDRVRHRLFYGGATIAASNRMIHQRRQLVEEWEHLLADIRLVPGFERFLAPPSLKELQPAAAAGPVVAINVSQYRSDALILTTEGIHAVGLPDLTPHALREQVVTFFAALDDAQHPGRTLEERWQAEQAILGVLAWLWDTVTGPVLTTLGLDRPHAVGQRWPQVWWSPTGLLSFLPLHAAAHRPAGRAALRPLAVIDCVVSSYAPTVRALKHAQERRAAPPTERPRAVVIALPHTPGLPDLPAAPREATLLKRRLSGTVPLIGPDATRERVLMELRSCAWAHFACHGSVHMTNPSSSHLRLHDGPLSVLQISRLHLDRAELAVLSACNTSLGSARLADEALHIAAAFQLAGYTHVVGTLWPIDDDLAPLIASDLYAIMLPVSHRPTTNIGGTAIALHTAILNLRDRRRYWLSPSLWAAYIHVGP